MIELLYHPIALLISGGMVRNILVMEIPPSYERSSRMAALIWRGRGDTGKKRRIWRLSRR